LFSRYKKKIIFSIVFGALVFLGLSIYANFNELLIAFSQYKWIMFPVVLLLSFCNYIMRFLKFDYYLKVLDIKTEKKMSFLIFMSSFIMSITPGKIGEVFKSYLLKEHYKTPISKSAPIVIAERITDFISLVILSLIGALIYGYGKGLIIGIGLFFVFILVIISSKTISYKIISLFEKFRFFSKISQKVHIAYDSIYQMVQIKELIITVFLSIFAWFFECLGFYLVLNGFGIENVVYVSIFVATFIYGFATIAGAVTMLPAGLGATDASITGLLILLQIPKNISVASTLIIRVATLWFAVIVGIIAIIIYQKISHKKVSEISLES
jgi:glycosyltransferase 2 family protein